MASYNPGITTNAIDAVIVVRDPAMAHEPFCSRTFLERHVEILGRLGVTDIRCVPFSPAAPIAPSRRQIVVAAERVFDARLYDALLKAKAPSRLVDGPRAIGLETVEPGRETETIDVRDLPTYSRELRRSLPLLWQEIDASTDRVALIRLLVDASGKGHQDLPAMVINAPIEKALVRHLAPTRITPNQLTALCNVLAYGVAALLASGHLLLGALGGLIVGVVDGLDGRQARVQIRTSEVGRLEHLFDKIYELLWMVALAHALSKAYPDLHAWRGLSAWSVAYVLDSAAYDVVKWRTGTNLDESSRIDAAIRLVAGRRNVYTCMLLTGVLAGRPDLAWIAIVGWAMATAVVHGVRALAVLRRASAVLRSVP